jgi:hypothetical protein
MREALIRFSLAANQSVITHAAACGFVASRDSTAANHPPFIRSIRDFAVRVHWIVIRAVVWTTHQNSLSPGNADDCLIHDSTSFGSYGFFS